MTREEAIAIIENEKKCVNRANKNDYCNRDCYNCELVKTDIEILTALDMAIQALEQEPIDKSAMMYEIYMKGVNMSGEYQGCWVRFKDIEKIVDKYMGDKK